MQRARSFLLEELLEVAGTTVQRARENPTQVAVQSALDAMKEASSNAPESIQERLQHAVYHLADTLYKGNRDISPLLDQATAAVQVARDALAERDNAAATLQGSTQEALDAVKKLELDSIGEVNEWATHAIYRISDALYKGDVKGIQDAAYYLTVARDVQLPSLIRVAQETLKRSTQ